MSTRLAHCTPNQTVPGTSPLTFPRARISAVFGGSPQPFISPVGKDRPIVNDNSVNICYQEKWNPWCPRHTGEHGIIFRSPEGLVPPIPNPEPNGVTLFRATKSAKWLYIGQYRTYRVDPISGAEWKTLPEWVRSAIPSSRFPFLISRLFRQRGSGTV